MKNGIGDGYAALARMRRRHLGLLIFSCLVLVCCLTDAQGAAPSLVARLDLASPHLPDCLIILPREGVSQDQLKLLHAQLGMRVRKRSLRSGGTQALEGYGKTDLRRMIEAYLKSGLIEIAEPDYIIKATGLLEPNDPAFVNGLQWGLRNTGQSGGLTDADIDASEGWASVRVARSTVVAVIDSGVRYTHEDLVDNIWVNPGEIPDNGLDDDRNGVVDDVHGFNAFGENGDPFDPAGHGTHVAGIIGAMGNNGRGVSGVAWETRIMALRFLDDEGSGAISDAIQCIDYAIAQGAHVVNASWGSSGSSRALQRAIDRLARISFGHHPTMG